MTEIYVVTMKKNDWDEDSWVEGVYTSKEKAREGILATLRELDPNAPTLSLETYAFQEEEEIRYFWEIQKFKVQ